MALNVWRTVMIGGKSADVLVRELDAGNFRVNEFAKLMMRQSTFVTTRSVRQARLCRVSLKVDLGIRKELVSFREICARARQAGMVLCPSELGPHLRLQYGDQPYGEYLWVAMKPIPRVKVAPSIYHLGNSAEQGAFLVPVDALVDEEIFYAPKNLFVFVVPDN